MAKEGENQARFERYVEVDPETGCHIWTGSRDRCGYGVFGVTYGGKNRLMKAHRMAYQGYVDWIPDGMHVLHRCDNPSCVNPDHLFLGTNADNSQDMVEKGRSSKGVDLPQSKLTDDIVREARKLYRLGGITYKSLADKYGVTYTSMRYAIIGFTWKHVVEAEND